jgi:hypothetical protein
MWDLTYWNIIADTAHMKLKACLLYVKNGSKLVSFMNRKNIFHILKPVNYAQLLPQCKHRLKDRRDW